eukprot:9535018-Alexandrium_andersonii.AAC.1
MVSAVALAQAHRMCGLAMSPATGSRAPRRRTTEQARRLCGIAPPTEVSRSRAVRSTHRASDALAQAFQ